MSRVDVPEPLPQGEGDVVVFRALEEVMARSVFGVKKYHTLLKTNNGRDSLMDALQEAIDLVMYLTQAIMEREEHGNVLPSDSRGP